MTEFEVALTDALASNGGRVSFEQVCDLLPAPSRHKVMKHLNGAKISGVCNYTLQKEDGKQVIVITSPDSVTPSAVAPQSGQPLAGGSE